MVKDAIGRQGWRSAIEIVLKNGGDKGCLIRRDRRSRPRRMTAGALPGILSRSNAAKKAHCPKHFYLAGGGTKSRTSSAASRIGGASPRATTNSQFSCRQRARRCPLLD